VGNAEQIIEAKKKTGAISHDLEYKPDISKERGNGGLSEKVDAAVRGIADTVSFGLADKLAAAGDTLTDPNSSLGQNLAKQFAISDYDAQNHFPSRTAGQLAGAVALPMGAMESVPQVAAKAGAVGAAYGAGSSRSLSDVPGNAAVGLAAGAGLGAGLKAGGDLAAKGVRAVGRKFAGQADPEAEAILRAGSAENVPVYAPDIYPETRNTISTLESMPGSSGPIRKGLNAGSDAIRGRVSDLGVGGSPLEANTAGQTVRNVGERYIKKSGEQLGRRYDTLEKATAGIKVPAKEAVGVIDNVLGNLSETSGTNSAEIAYLKTLKGDLSKDLSIGALRRIRTTLRKKIAKGELTFGEDEATVLSVMDAASNDIANGLRAAGKPRVAEEFANVDGAYRQRMDFVRNTVQKLIGKRGQNVSPEQVFNNLKALASPKGDEAGLGRLIREMEPEERADIAATFAEALGKNNKGDFTLDQLDRQINKMPKAVRVHLFGPEGAKSLDNLAILARAKNPTVKNLNNSRSGMVTNYRSVLSTVLFGLPGGGAALGLAQAANLGTGVTGAVAGAALGGTGLALSRTLSKALMNEEFTRALANAPASTSPKVIDAHFGKLRQIAAKDPNVRAVVEALEKKLLSHANDNATRAAAASDPNSEQNQ
jgi:hypothetical protein